jgi:signal transduction histidine kinase
MIQDEGTGIAPQVLPHIFESFYSTKGSKGNGLGLAISKEIVERHGGKIEVESIVGQGTTFKVLLPKQ